ncbi:MAG: protoporphyrinogen oxidase, partial [Planctomycetaceae bacterium]
YGLFVTLADGLQTLVDALHSRIACSATVCLNAVVTALNPVKPPPPKPTAPLSNCDANGVGLGRDDGSQAGAWQLILADGSQEPFDAVVLALPAFRAADLVAGFDTQLAEELRGIEYASSAVVVTGHQLKDVEHPLDAFGLVVPAIENRRVLAVSFTSRKFPGRAPEGCVQLRTFLGGALQPELLSHSDDELIAVVRAELRELLGVGGVEDFAFVSRHDRAMPQYHVGHLDRVRRIETLCHRHERLSLCGNAYHGVGLPDCIADAHAAVERAACDEAISGPSHSEQNAPAISQTLEQKI